jgi:hypothetical protein
MMQEDYPAWPKPSRNVRLGRGLVQYLKCENRWQEFCCRLAYAWRAFRGWPYPVRP